VAACPDCGTLKRMLKPKCRAALPTNGYKGETAGYANWLLPWMPHCPAVGCDIKMPSSAV